MYDIDPISLQELSVMLNGQLYGENDKIDSIYLNSKEKVNENSCFIAINGKKYNGIDFFKESINNGAKAIISEKIIDTAIPYIKVDDSIKALGIIAKRQAKGKTIIGITGSAGKTTTKNMIISVLGQKYSTSGTNENENNEIGVPITLLNAKKHNVCVVEMGMRGLGQIDYLASLSNPETAIITNIGSSHIELLKSKEHIFKAKMEILNYNPLNFVSIYDKRYSNFDFQKTHTYFLGENTNCRTDIINIDKTGIEFRVFYNDKKSEKMKIYSLNTENLKNALLSYKVGKLYGLTDKEIGNGLAKYKQETMREKYEKIGDIMVINDAYNASLESVKASINLLSRCSKIYNKRSNILLGDMLEIGKNENEYYEEIFELCKMNSVRKIYLFGERIRNYMALCTLARWFSDKESLAKEIMHELGKKDILLVKGSREVKLEKVLEEMRKIQ